MYHVVSSSILLSHAVQHFFKCHLLIHIVSIGVCTVKRLLDCSVFTWNVTGIAGTYNIDAHLYMHFRDF